VLWSNLLKKLLLEDRRRAIPLSSFLFAATALWVGLQHISALGVFMVFLLAPLWSILLLNAAFVGIGAEAAIGRVSRLWLALPIAWFGGYLLFAAADHRALEALRLQPAADTAGAGLEVGSVSSQDFETRFRSLPVTLRTTTVTTDDGRVFTSRRAYASPLPWLPMPVVGCNPWATNQCEASFWRETPVPVHRPLGAAPADA
jgi:hypothetical protein